MIQSKIPHLIRCMEDGQKAADALKIGDVFLGAAPAAEAAGLDRTTTEGRMFITGYLDRLAVRTGVVGGVTTDQDGRILAIGADTGAPNRQNGS